MSDASIPPCALTVAQAIKVYLDNARPYSARAFEESRRILDLFCESFGERPVDDCRPVDLLVWVNTHTEWVSDWTILRVIATIKRPLTWAAKLRLIGSNPFFGVSHTPGEAGRPMTEEEFRRLLRGTTPLFRRVLVFLRFTGCRPGEMSILEWAHLDLARCCIVLRKHKTARSRKDRAPRLIILHPVVLKLLAWIRRHGPHERFVFVNSRGRDWNRSSLALRIWRLREKMGIPLDCRLYGLRHAFGTRAVLNSTELKTLAELMGHTTTRMTERYVHLAGNTGHLQQAILKALG